MRQRFCILRKKFFFFFQLFCRPRRRNRPPSWGVFTLLLHYYSMMIDEGEDGAGGGRQGGIYMAVFCSFSSSSRPETGSGFCSSARLPGPPPPQIMRWQTGPLYNRSGVEPVRLNTVYAFNRLLLPAGLEPGTSPTIPSRQDLPAPSYSPPSTCRQARRFPCMVDYI